MTERFTPQFAPLQFADRAIEYKRRGANLLLLGFLHFQEEVEHFGRHVLPIIREKEAELARRKPALAAN